MSSERDSPDPSEPRRRAGFADHAFAQFRSELHRYLLRRLHKTQDVEDLSQEVYLRLLRVADRNAVKHPQAYVYRVAYNVLYEFKSHENRSAVAFDSDTASDAAEHLADDAATPEELYEQQGRKARLAGIVEQLPPMQRTVFLLAKHQDLSCDDIGRKLGISSNTARVHLYRALCYCREKLANE